MNAEKMAFFYFFLFFSLYSWVVKKADKKGLLILCAGMSELGEQGGARPPQIFLDQLTLCQSAGYILYPTYYYSPPPPPLDFQNFRHLWYICNEIRYSCNDFITYVAQISRPEN